MKAFPWPDVMAFGLGVLCLAPETFWRMTVREIASAAGSRSRPSFPSMNRSAFAALRQRFPDTSA